MRPILAMVADVFAFNRRRLIWALLLSAVASLLEGVGLALLVPLLSFALQGDGAAQAAAVLGVDLPYPVLIWGTLAGFVVVALAATWFGWRRTVLSSAIRTGFVADLSKRVQAGALGMRPEHAAAEDRVALTHLMITDVVTVGSSVQFLFTVAGQMMRIPALAVVILTLSPGSALAMGVILGLVVLVARPFDRRAKREGARLIKTATGLLGRSDTNLQSAPLIKTQKAERHWSGLYARAVNQVYGTQHALAEGQASAQAISTVGGVLGVVAIVAVALAALDEPLSQTAVLVLALSRLLPATVLFHSSLRSAIAALPSHGRVADFLERAASVAEPEVPQSDATGPADVAVSEVSIARQAGGAAVVQGVSAQLPKGQMTVIMGRSGAGKSTLALGLAGLLPLEGGTLHLDGKALSGDDRLLLRRAAVMLPQDPVLLNTDVATNLRLGAPEASEQAMWDALQAAAAKDFVASLPDGLNAPIGDRGTRLSGGERQRIALAQALIANPRLLVLDEATSALDAETEDHVLQSVLALRGQTTVVFVTHRSAIAERADHVLVMAEGRISQAGTWDDIAAQRSASAQL